MSVDIGAPSVNGKKDEFKTAIELWIKSRNAENSLSSKEIGALDGFDRIDALRKGAILQISLYYAENSRADVSIGVISVVGMMADNDRGVCTLSQSTLAKILHRNRTNVSRTVAKLVKSGRLISMGKPGLESVLTLAIPKALACRNHIVWFSEVLAETNMVVPSSAHPTPPTCAVVGTPPLATCADNRAEPVPSSAHKFTIDKFTHQEEDIYKYGEHTLELSPSGEDKEGALQGLEFQDGSESQVSWSVGVEVQGKEQQPVNHNQSDGPQPQTSRPAEPLVGSRQESPSPGSAAPLPAVRPAGVPVLSKETLSQWGSIVSGWGGARGVNSYDPYIVASKVKNAVEDALSRSYDHTVVRSALRATLDHMEGVMADEEIGARRSDRARQGIAAATKYFQREFDDELERADAAHMRRIAEGHVIQQTALAKIETQRQIGEKQLGAMDAAIERNAARSTAPAKGLDEIDRIIGAGHNGNSHPAEPSRFSETAPKVAAPCGIWISGSDANSIMDRIETSTKQQVLEALRDFERMKPFEKPTDTKIIDWCVDRLLDVVLGKGPHFDARQRQQEAAASLGTTTEEKLLAQEIRDGVKVNHFGRLGRNVVTVSHLLMMKFIPSIDVHSLDSAMDSFRMEGQLDEVRREIARNPHEVMRRIVDHVNRSCQNMREVSDESFLMAAE